MKSLTREQLKFRVTASSCEKNEIDSPGSITVVAFVSLKPNVVQQMTREHAPHHLQPGRDQFGLRGQ